MDRERIEELAGLVDQAAQSGRTLTMLTADHPDLDLNTAYTVQRRSIARRLARGERLCGMKMGLTSTAKMEQMGVHDPIYGHLTNSMTLAPGGTLHLEGLVHPRVEPEIAFVLANDLSGTVTPDEAMAAVATVHPAIEVIDSRYTDFKFTLIDVVADNTSACRYVLGAGSPAAQTDLGDLRIDMTVGDPVMADLVGQSAVKQCSGSSQAILDHPAKSLARLAAMLATRGEGLKAGQTILAGAATAAVHVAAGDRVTVDVAQLGSVHFDVAK